MQLARTLKDQRQPGEAKAAWTHALALLTELSTTAPEAAGIHRTHLDCANDFAWFLLSEPDGDAENLPLALRLATQATRAQPECGAYWNTLGAAAFRAGDPTGAIAALERSIALTDGGNAFDHIFISMANGQLGRREEARRWYVRATAWIEEHDSHHASLLTLYEEAGTALDSQVVPSPVP